ncbi:helix-turn-helix domain-containing protein [Halomonas halocynthiae]|uniref:response regulator transcription factor n=1 Tax=Halomonas halocynthiae TaxID=176290 RepID=UPI000422FDC3|nr:helix-turn-helix domain-containing protein [Halomonas halocynthiae]
MTESKRILVVEGVEAERTLLSSYLQQQGHRVFLAKDGRDGINKARLIKPDLVLMSLMIPEIDGYAACKILTEDAETQGVPVVLLSSHTSTEKKVRGLQAGAIDYISKPFDFDELRLRLSIYLNRYSKTSAPHKPLPEKKSNGGEGSEFKNEKCDDESLDGYCDKPKDNIDTLLFYSARVILLKDLSVSPGLAQLARMVGTSSKKLNGAFKNYIGMTVFEYLREERMKEAAKLLRNTGCSVSDVGERVGFSSGANFSTAFTKRFGIPPAKYRSEHVYL